MGRTTPELFGIPAKEIARLCRVDLTTARRWVRGAVCPPATAIMILARDLGVFSDYWRGWRINGEDIVSPEGWCISRGDAMIVPLMHGQIAALRADLAKAREELKVAPGLEEQPTPLEWANYVG